MTSGLVGLPAGLRLLARLGLLARLSGLGLLAALAALWRSGLAALRGSLRPLLSWLGRLLALAFLLRGGRCRSRRFGGRHAGGLPRLVALMGEAVERDDHDGDRCNRGEQDLPRSCATGAQVEFWIRLQATVLFNGVGVRMSHGRSPLGRRPTANCKAKPRQGGRGSHRRYWPWPVVVRGAVAGPAGGAAPVVAAGGVPPVDAVRSLRPSPKMRAITTTRNTAPAIQPAPLFERGMSLRISGPAAGSRGSLLEGSR
jgi:hypothetical protein